MSASRFDTVLGRVGRRLRLAWTFATGQWAGPMVAGAALAFVVIGWLRPWGWPERTAIAVAVIAVLALLFAALAIRIPRTMAARAADRGLGAKDTFATALELDDEGRDDALAQHVKNRAADLAEGASARTAIPLRADKRRLAVTGALAVGALALGLAANPQDKIRAERKAEQEILADEADTLDEQAGELLDDPDATPEQQQLAEDLQELADELRSAQDLDEGLEALEETQAELEASIPRNQLAQKAATQGLDKSLEQNPLPGATPESGAADQLAEAAEQLDELTPEEQAELAETLEDLADSQEAGNKEAADALREAAEQLQAGNPAAAAAAMGQASDAQASASAASASAASRQASAEDIAKAAQRAKDRAEGQGQGEGEGEGEGQGEGEGEGEGQGEGQGQGQGEGGEGGGQGSGNGGSPSGDVAGGGGGADAEGQGGEGRPQGDGETEAGGARGEGEDFLYDPAFGEGEELRVDAQSTDGEGEIIGQADGPTSSGGSRVPLADALPKYERRATDALRGDDIPPSQRAIVRDYFDSLAER